MSVLVLRKRDEIGSIDEIKALQIFKLRSDSSAGWSRAGIGIVPRIGKEYIYPTAYIYRMAWMMR